MRMNNNGGPMKIKTMSTLSLKIPAVLHRRLRERASKTGTKQQHILAVALEAELAKPFYIDGTRDERATV